MSKNNPENVMPVVTDCPMCGVALRDHLGVIGTCRKHHAARLALTELIAASETAVGVLRTEFGSKATEANFGDLLNAIHVAKRAHTDG